MKSMLRLWVVGVFALLIVIPAAFAQTPEVSKFPVTEPTDVGGTILQPGVYTIRVLPSFANRDQIQITSPDLKKVYATVLTVPHQLKPTEEVPNATFVFYPAEESLPQALRTWYAKYPDVSGGGHDIVYEETRAKQLARLTKAPVVSYRADTAVADLNKAELHVVTPESTVETYTYTPPAAPAVAESPAPATTAPMTSAAPETPAMPRTASRLPLLALLGLASLGAAVVIRFARTS